MWNILKKTWLMVMMCLCLTFAAAPAMEIHAATQTEQPAEGTSDTQEQTAGTSDEEGAFLLILMGGGLLIILFAVIAAMSTVSGAISVAVNMDVDGE